MLLNRVNLLNLSTIELTDFMAHLGEPGFRARQLAQWIYQRDINDFTQMTNLSRKLQAKLNQIAIIEEPETVLYRSSMDGTDKWLLRLNDGNKIETVYIPEPRRGTLCISSQVGCALNCSFCATGKQGFNRNLSLSEIIGQLRIVKRWLDQNKPHVPLTNIVMMGMGEPLLNYHSVVAAMHWMMSDLAYGLSKYRVTLSTAGMVPKMQSLKNDSDCALAISLHAPNDSLRNHLVPLNKKYPLKALMAACQNYYARSSKRKITFEYVMLDQVNDQPHHAQQLAKLVAPIPGKINLIPFNAFPGSSYRCSSLKNIRAFQKILIQHGLNTRVRKTRGEDIHAACGQLAGDFLDRTGRYQRWQNTGMLTPVPSVLM